MTYDFRITTAAGAVSHVSLPADVFRENNFGLLWEMPKATVVRVEIKAADGSRSSWCCAGWRERPARSELLTSTPGPRARR